MITTMTTRQTGRGRCIGNAGIEYSVFSAGGCREFHLKIKPSPFNPFISQVIDCLRALWDFTEGLGANAPHPLFLRCFVSDYANQAEILSLISSFGEGMFARTSISVVQQPPVTGEKVVIWAYLVGDGGGDAMGDLRREGRDLVLVRGPYTHIWTAGLTHLNGSWLSGAQTAGIMGTYALDLEKRELSLADNCIRTWLFVKDVDVNYQGVVAARKALFEGVGLTPDTHYISSTGIEGRHSDPRVNVLMDAYSVGGLLPDQVRFLTAREMLNPTHEYGVTFERGTAVDYGDRRHVFISGTASIDHRGRVVHVGDVAAQTRRAMDNIRALLEDAGADMDDVSQMIVYLRDMADRRRVESYFESRYPAIPKVIVLAPVCRPEWLIEIECMAVKSIHNPSFPNF